MATATGVWGKKGIGRSVEGNSVSTVYWREIWLLQPTTTSMRPKGSVREARVAMANTAAPPDSAGKIEAVTAEGGSGSFAKKTRTTGQSASADSPSDKTSETRRFKGWPKWACPCIDPKVNPREGTDAATKIPPTKTRRTIDLTL
jgi:hypothetical protein